ncbi:MAG: hypothetical protein AB1722_10785 [Pseudomonadota bacterium]
MSDLVLLFLPLPVITAMAYLMDIEERDSLREVLLRVIRWDLAFLLMVGLEYHYWLD